MKVLIDKLVETTFDAGRYRQMLLRAVREKANDEDFEYAQNSLETEEKKVEELRRQVDEQLRVMEAKISLADKIVSKC